MLALIFKGVALLLLMLNIFGEQEKNFLQILGLVQWVLYFLWNIFYIWNLTIFFNENNDWLDKAPVIWGAHLIVRDVNKYQKALAKFPHIVAIESTILKLKFVLISN